jgi:NADH-quinone oxidoreductase subunit M
MNILAILLFLPLLGFLLTLLLPSSVSKRFVLGFSLVIFAVSLLLIGTTMERPGQMTSVTDALWIETPAIRFHVGIDGISLWLVLLTTFLVPIAAFISLRSINHRVKEFFGFLLLLEFGLIGVFCSLDLFLYYVFWEVVLVPMYFLIGIWGGERRIYAATKFFVYTMAGSMLMLVAILFIYSKANTFDLPAILLQLETGKLAFTYAEELALFLAFLLAFAVKVPIFPLHTWLPDAYAEAPTAGTLLMAAVLSKMGTYSLLRFNLNLFPHASHDCAPWIAVLAIIGIVYGALVALVQPNMKRLVAYSSISHLGFVVLGLFSGNQYGLDGAAYQMLCHAISTGALFILIGYLEERNRSLEIADFGGLATPAPNFAAVFLVATLASIGLPLLNNFVGEFLILQGAAQANVYWAGFAALGVVLSACYMLWFYQRTFFGVAKAQIADLAPREWIAVTPLLILMLWMGIFTQTWLPGISASNKVLLDRPMSKPVVALQVAK